ncbi:LOW QUALITY PROTEIN: hypothetical protein MAR_007045 [Mya arenaria]|uniref:Uncharacterized protein n=1 Tax=Mya arenaria TaxID=6604 RepID=A0ABY7DA85_MYAAR|nr:LOW QUALITY PROTEIN: hypothetical protein MAR_007045 [Mya arenaria]
MSQPLHTGNYRWIEKKDLKDLKDNCIIECDLEYPKEIHNLHSDYPLAPEKLVMNDTDSLCYEIKTKDAYEDLHADKHIFDNSDYPNNSKYYFDDNKKVIGKMKDEAAGTPITEFVGLRSKMYSYTLNNKHAIKKCKGITEGVVKK